MADDHQAAPDVPLARAIRRTEGFLDVLAGIAIITIMIAQSADAIFRYSLNMPLRISYDLAIYYFMIMVVFLPLATTFRMGRNISMDMIRLMMPARIRNMVDIFSCLLMLAVALLILVGAWEKMVTAWTIGQYRAGVYSWPVWHSYLAIVLGSFVLCLRIAHHIVIRALWGADPSVETEEGFEE